MDKKTYQEALAMLATSGLFASEYRYYKDRYSIALLQASLPDDGSPVAIAALKRSRSGYLLDKPKVASLVKQLRGQPLARHHLRGADCDRSEVSYRLGFASWGAMDYWAGQTSRQGLNLVIQLNFDRAHDAAFERLVKPSRGQRPFCRSSHPHSRSRNTMAWARVDLDFEQGEALIEEVQTDWLREVRWAADEADWALTPDPRGRCRVTTPTMWRRTSRCGARRC